MKAERSLPLKTRQLLVEKIEIFKKNPIDPRLHAKKLSGELEYFHSLRLTRDYRVVYYFENKNKAVFVDIGHRKDIYE